MKPDPAKYVEGTLDGELTAQELDAFDEKLESKFVLGLIAIKATEGYKEKGRGVTRVTWRGTGIGVDYVGLGVVREWIREWGSDLRDPETKRLIDEYDPEREAVVVAIAGKRVKSYIVDLLGEAA
jgi:hypothetical protein